MTETPKFRKCQHDFEWESGYGFAAGGLGSYEYQSCKKCGALGDKTRNFIPDTGDEVKAETPKFKRAFTKEKLHDGNDPIDHGYLIEEIERCYEIIDAAIEMAEHYAETHIYCGTVKGFFKILQPVELPEEMYAQKNILPKVIEK